MAEYLEKINSPEDVKLLDLNQLEVLCAEIRQYMIECCAINPGHIGASLGAVEIAVALHKVFNTPEDRIVWDVGHQAYAHKIITGRREAFKGNRTRNGISGFPKRSESPYDSFGAGHASNSISAALGMAVASEKLGMDNRHIAVIGDGAMTGGLAFEGLNNAGAMKTNLLVILNDNQMAIDKETGALHNHLMRIITSAGYNKFKKRVWDHLGSNATRSYIQKVVKRTKRALVRSSSTSSLFDALGFRYFGPIDGNDIRQMVEMLERLKNVTGPKILHVVTKKGKGFGPAEDNQTVWHAPGMYDPETGERVGSSASASKYQDVFGQTLLDLATADSRIVGVTPAMATGCGMILMMQQMPDRVFDVGIAEGHAVTFSAGLAAEGMIPFCNIYSSFMQRGYDNVIHDIALQKLKVIICLDRGGIVGEDGATHHGVFDMACFRPVPDLFIASPMNERELRNLMWSATGTDYPATIIRYPRGCGEGVAWKGEPFEKIEPGTARRLHDGSDIALLSIGPVGNLAAEAVRKAEKEKGVNVLHFDMRFLKPLDEKALEEACRCRRIITVEDGTVKGGLYGAVCEYAAGRGFHCEVIGMGIPDRFIEQGTVKELRMECGFSAEQIFERIIG